MKNTTNEATANSPWLNTEQAARYLGISPRTLQDYRKVREGPQASRLGGKRLIRYHRHALDAWMQSASKV